MGSLLSFLCTTSKPRVYYGSTSADPRIAYRENSRNHLQTLDCFLSQRCPSVFGTYSPAWWLFNGHLQIAYCTLGDFSRVDDMIYERTLIRTVDGGTIGLDFTPPQYLNTLKYDTPIVVVLHGLTGGSHESYVRSVLKPACTPVEMGGLGFRGVVVTFRGCAGVPLTSPQLYSAGHTDDVRVAVYYLRKKYPKARLIGLGFSAGANVLTRYLAEEGKCSRLTAGCVLACPWNLFENSNLRFHRIVYSAGLGQNLQKVVRNHQSSLIKSSAGPAVNEILALRRPTMQTFDQRITRLIGGSSPPFPFSSTQHYYQWASCHNVLHKISVPFLAFNDLDDPILQAKLPYDLGCNALVAMVVTRGGGHLGWFESGGCFNIGRWTTVPVIEWLRAVGNDLIDEYRSERVLHETRGYLQEDGRDDIGCMEIATGLRGIGIEGQQGSLPHI